MKLFIGLTDLWCFPIIGEETWAGVCLRGNSTQSDKYLNLVLESSHVTSSQLCPCSTPGQS
jgi:hypothetical protein